MDTEKPSRFCKVTELVMSVEKLGFEPRHLASETLVIITFLHGLFKRNKG